MIYKDRSEQLIIILQKLAYPERWAEENGYHHWFTGDGPAEYWYDELAEQARKLMEGREG